MPRDTSGQVVEREFLTLRVWDQFDAQTAETVARSVERCLPEPWVLLGLEWHESGGQKRHVAFFDLSGVAFALIPGGDATLGFDPARPNVPAERVEDWEQDARRREGWEDVAWTAYLAEILSPLRTVRIEPFLIATIGRARSNTSESGAEFRRQIRAGALRLPTADEWEYACAAGTRSLWHWGDDPDGRTPRNAFGLEIASNTYHQEALDQPGHYRGGDGGERFCGGEHPLECLLPLSSWFRSSAGPSLEDRWPHTLYRPVLPLPQAMFG